MNIPSPAALAMAVLCTASLTLLMRLFSANQSNRYGMILGNYLTCSLIGFLLIPQKAMLFAAHPATVACGIAGGVLFVLSLVCMQTSISVSGAILTSAFSKLGLIVPIALSIFLFHEMPTLLQGAGLLIVLCAFLVMNRSSGPDRPQEFHLMSLLIVLLTGGMADAMAKVYSTYQLPEEEPVYMFILFVCASVLTTFLLFWEMQRTGKTASFRDLASGIAIGIPNYFSSLFMLAALRTIPSFIVYPVFSAGGILLVTAAGILLFHERLSRNQSLGLLMILVSLVLLNI
ncbi:MAG: EamA family transporter [Solobacterium sp.]|nr:EamA family transporter [Solobacterium sp.]